METNEFITLKVQDLKEVLNIAIAEVKLIFFYKWELLVESNNGVFKITSVFGQNYKSSELSDLKLKKKKHLHKRKH